jgi:hypothetical protein
MVGLVGLLLSGCGASSRSDDGPVFDGGADADADTDADSDADSDTDSDVPLGCSDVDGDGFGVGSDCLGPDCDDSNPDVHAREVCEAACDADPHATGCPCDPRAFPEPEICYGGPPGTLGFGSCRAGLRVCEGDAWAACNGQVLPGSEVCDEVDNDCNGEIDDGVTNECGTCGSGGCDCIGVGCSSDFSPDAASGATTDAEGALLLEEGETAAEHRETFRACEGECVSWIALHWDAETPAGTSIRLETRDAATLDELGLATWSVVATIPPDDSPASLPYDDFTGYQFLEVRITFTSDDPGVTPRLLRLSAEFECSLVIC